MTWMSLCTETRSRRMPRGEAMDDDGRRSIRVVAPIPVSLMAGEDPPRHGLTAVVNRHGALLLSPASYEPGTIVWLRNDLNSETVRCRVVWVGLADSSGTQKLGVEFTDDAPTFWDPIYAEAVRAVSGGRLSA